MTLKSAPYRAYVPQEGAAIEKFLYGDPEAYYDDNERAMAVLLKNKEDAHYYHPKNGNYTKLEKWEINGYSKLLKMFATDPKTRQWKRYPRKFVKGGMWRETSYEELKKALDLQSEYRVKETLRRMERHGLISRERRRIMKRNGVWVTKLYITVNIYRFIEVMEKAKRIVAECYKNKRATKSQATRQIKDISISASYSPITNVKVDDVSTDSLKQNPGENASVSDGCCPPSGNGDRSPLGIILVLSEMASGQKEKLFYLKEKEYCDTGSVDKAIFLIKDRTKLPAHWHLKTYSEETKNIVTLLQERFPLDQFTIGVLNRIQRLAKWRAGQKACLSPGLIEDWLWMAGGAYIEAGNWRYGDIQDVAKLLRYWPGISRDMQRIRSQERIFDAESLLNSCTENQVRLELNNELNWMRNRGRESKLTNEAVVNGQLNSPWSEASIRALAQAVLLSRFNADVQPFLAPLVPRLQKAFFDDPRFFVHLSKDYPLQQWARMTDKQCQAVYEKLEQQRSGALHRLTEKYVIGEQYFVNI